MRLLISQVQWRCGKKKRKWCNVCNADSANGCTCYQTGYSYTDQEDQGQVEWTKSGEAIHWDVRRDEAQKTRQPAYYEHVSYSSKQSYDENYGEKTWDPKQKYL